MNLPKEAEPPPLRALAARAVAALRVTRDATLVLAACLAACATKPTALPQDAGVRAFAAQGYDAAEHHEVFASAHALTAAGRSLRLQLLRPKGASAPSDLPLVLYLPGLGETAEAGKPWRQAWAEAGYAVLSLQALDDDARAWQSELARSGEFKALGRQRFAAAALNQRLQVLADVLAEARRLGAAGEAAWQGLDWRRVAVAGFDLGAYTAMALAGEHVPGADDALASRLPVRAALALSPHASVASGGLATRYRDIHVPVLSITSDVDSDVLGLVDSVALRIAPFDHMPGPDKLLLSLQGMPHAALGGDASVAAARAQAAPAQRPQESAGRGDGGGGGGQRQRGGRQRGGAGAGSGGDGRGARSNPDDNAGAALQGLGAVQMRTVAAQVVSTAFLDAYLKDDAMAREWLAADAQRWLGGAGTLRRK